MYESLPMFRVALMPAIKATATTPERRLDNASRYLLGLHDSMRCRGEILHDVRGSDPGLARGRRRVSAAANETRHTGSNDCADRSDVAVLDGGERGLLRAAVWRIDQYDVGRFAGREQSAVEVVNVRVATGRRADKVLRRHVGEARKMRYGIQHTEGHYPAAGWCVGRDDEAFEHA